MEAGKRFVLGRDPRASAVFHAEDVSRQHAELTWEGEPLTPLLGEVRSKNGTFLANKRLESREPQPVRSGDEIRLGGSVRLTYLHLTERDLRKELESRAGSDTRRFEVVAQSPQSVVKTDDTRVLGDLVAAALGEVELVPLEEAGDFQQLSGSVLVKRLYSEQRSGVLTVYDGTDAGELHLIDGRCQHAILGALSGRDALRHVAALSVGQFRFFPEARETMAATDAPGDVDEQGLALAGKLADMPGSLLVRDLVARKATGVLTLFNGQETGCLILEGGVCKDVQLGAVRDREALDAVVRLRRGVFRFRPCEIGGPAAVMSAGDWNTPVPGIDRSSTRIPRSALRPPPSAESVQRRSSTPMRSGPSTRPMRAPPGSGSMRRAPPGSDRHTRRQRPPLPKRRQPPPKPY